MKLQQPIMESTSSLAWADEIWNILTCGLVLLLGYGMTRAWLCYRNALAMKAKLQKIDTIDFDDDDASAQTSNKRHVDKATVSTSPTRAKSSSRQANAQMRKRLRKGKGPESSIDADNCAIEEAAEGDGLQSYEHQKETIMQTQTEGCTGNEMTETTTVETCGSVETSTVAACDLAETSIAEECDMAATTAAEACTRIVSEADEEERSPPKPLHTGDEMTETTTMEACDSAETSTVAACDMAETSTAEECDATEPMAVEACTCIVSEADEEEQSPLKTECETSAHCAKPEEKGHQLWADVVDEDDATDDEVSERLQEEALQEQGQQQMIEPDVLLKSSLEQQRPSSITFSGMLPCHVNWDLIESDSDDDNEAVFPIVDTNCAPDATPVLWCSPPATPMHGGEGSPTSAMIAHVESWMPIAIPCECAPPGTLDGRWMNRDGEKILIEKLEIMFESGAVWNMTMHSPACISVHIDGAEFVAELDDEGEHLIWSDGDVWDFHGRVEVEQQEMGEESQPQLLFQHLCEYPLQGDVQLQPTWAYQAFGDHMASMESMQVWDGMALAPEGFAMSTEPVGPAVNEMIPADAGDWEICWDWKKKGCCPRGVACDWYHPPVAHTSPCQPCDTNFFQ
jgi:hypothetical protein